MPTREIKYRDGPSKIPLNSIITVEFFGFLVRGLMIDENLLIIGVI